jgi:uncharacterized membrane protein
MLSKSWIKFFIISLLILGIIFRFAHLTEKIYWVDEVATSLRVSGYTKSEVVGLLTTQGTVNVTALQRYQHPAPDKNFADLLQALTHSPEHSPLYFLLLRGWIECFGSSIAAIRSLSVLFSLLMLPLIYWLCQELFHSSLTGWLAIALLSISPFEVAYAQEARPYSLWSVTLLLSSITLLRAMRLKSQSSWVWYSISLTLSLYTSLLSVFVMIGQIVWAIAVAGHRNLKTVSAYFIATLLGLMTFAPWLLVIFYHWNAFAENTTWMRESLSLPVMTVIWLYSVAIMFADFPVYLAFDPVIVSALLADLGLLVLVGYSLWFLRKAGKAAQSLSLTLTFVPLCLLVLLDLAWGGQSSTAPRYLIPCHLGIWLSVTYLLTHKVFNMEDDFRRGALKQQLSWQMITVVLILLGVASCVVDLDRSPKYQKTRNLQNPAIAAIINQASSPIVLAESEALMDMLSLSYILEPKVKVKLLASTNEALTSSISRNCGDIFLLNPSETLINHLNVQSIQIRKAYQPKLLIPGEISLSLWAVAAPVKDCSTELHNS